MKNNIKKFKNYEIPTKKLSMIAGGYFVNGVAGSSCSSATSSSNDCSSACNCNNQCHCNFTGANTATVDSVFNYPWVIGMTSQDKAALYQASVSECENQSEISYLQSLLLS